MSALCIYLTFIIIILGYSSDSKRIYVGGMPYTIEESDVHDYFAECGVIENIDFMTFPDTGRFRGIAIITFKVTLK